MHSLLPKSVTVSRHTGFCCRKHPQTNNQGNIYSFRFVLFCFYSYLLNQIARLLIGCLAVSGTRLERFGGSSRPGLIITLHGTREGLSGDLPHPIAFYIVQHLGCLSLHLGVQGVRLRLDCCTRHILLILNMFIMYFIVERVCI